MSDRSSKNGKTSGVDKIRERRQQRASGEIADWATADAALVLETIANVSSAGGAIRFGYTRDGGAYAIGIYGSGEPFTEYVRPSEDINYYLQGLIEDFAGRHNGTPA